ncbi:MAG: hypothetical protein PHU17_00915 [Candidatus Pacebacteria bacterium]|nr:hypothetical protein [Candidatus Paceibacterota bacterium]MDD4074080.1 hypothetical protein [Candidatus Paceibacterota bacterium]
MDITEIRKIINEEGGKIIIPEEGGSPTLIVMSLDSYRKEKEAKHINKIEKPLREIEGESLKIEDLPFN